MKYKFRGKTEEGMMKGRIKKTDIRLGIKKGELYNIEPYLFDNDKIVLRDRLPDGYEPLCTQYRHEVEIIAESKEG
jgi:hypothetical protein